MARRKKPAPRRDPYEEITSEIIAWLEKDTRPWHQPWSGTGPVSRPLRHNGQPFSGVNVVRLWLAAKRGEHESPYWMTFNQARLHGGQVKKGEKAVYAIMIKELRRRETDTGTGEEEEKIIRSPRLYPVFNAEQIDRLPGHFYATVATASQAERIEEAEAFIASTGADIRHEANSAWYDPTADYINVPVIEQFTSPELYYSTICHELTHWTRHPDRLNRSFGREKFGDQGYAMEELVAELGSAFLSADLGLPPDNREDHASYIREWLKVLHNDNRAIFTAATHAQTAVAWLHDRAEKHEMQSAELLVRTQAPVPVQGELAFRHRPVHDIECKQLMVPRDQVAWREPQYSEGRFASWARFEGSVLKVSKESHRFRVTSCVPDTLATPGQVIERPRSLFQGHGAKRVRWDDEAQRARILKTIQEEIGETKSKNESQSQSVSVG